MKKKLTPYYGTYLNETRLVVSIRNLREVYSNEMKKHPALLGSYSGRMKDGKIKAHGASVGDWLSEIGIAPIKLDTSSIRSCFLLNDLTPRLEALKWEPDDEPIDSNSEIAEEEPESKTEALYTVESVNGILLQMLNQKMDFIIKELGGKFTLDESALLPLKEVAP